MTEALLDQIVLPVVWVLVGAILTIGIGLLRGWFRGPSMETPQEPRVGVHGRIAEVAGDAAFELDLQTRQVRWGTVPTGNQAVWPCWPQWGTDATHIHPDDRDAAERMWRGLEANEAQDLHVRMSLDGSSWHWFHLIAVPQRGYRAVGVLRGTTGFHRVQESLLEARRVEALGTIAGGIAHEFNNHLTPVRGYLELALDDLDETTPVSAGLRTALDRVLHCSELVSQIQTIGRKSMIHARPEDLSRTLQGAVEAALSRADPTATSVEVEQQIPAALPEVLLDRRLFRQAIGSLIQNGFEAMPQGGRLRIRCGLTAVLETDVSDTRDGQPGPHVVVEISDTGVGIPDDLLRQVVEPFYTTHGRARARGMGLPTVSGIMAQHGGWMQIRSEKGRGTCVCLYFPLAETPETPPVTGSSSPDSESSHSPAMAGRLLVADDDVFVRQMVRSLFEAREWVVDEAQDHEQALGVFRRTRTEGYDILLLDVGMPGPPAETTVACALKWSPQLRILIVSGCERSERVANLTVDPRVQFLPKPFSPRELTGLVEHMLAASDDTTGVTP